MGISVSDIQRSLAFYEALGFERRFLVERSEPFIGDITGTPGAHVKVAMLDREKDALELIEWINPRPRDRRMHYAEGDEKNHYPFGHIHVCFDANAAMLEVLHERASFVGNGQIPDGPQAGAIAMYFKGPDGEILEAFIPAAEVA